MPKGISLIKHRDFLWFLKISPKNHWDSRIIIGIEPEEMRFEAYSPTNIAMLIKEKGTHINHHWACSIDIVLSNSPHIFRHAQTEYPPISTFFKRNPHSNQPKIEHPKSTLLHCTIALRLWHWIYISPCNPTKFHKFWTGTSTNCCLILSPSHQNIWLFPHRVYGIGFITCETSWSKYVYTLNFLKPGIHIKTRHLPKIFQRFKKILNVQGRAAQQADEFIMVYNGL